MKQCFMDETYRVNNMERKDWTLLVVNAAGAWGLSPVQLQKSLFLIGKKLPSEVGNSFYKFEPYDYGPFDAAIYEDARTLGLEGLVTTSGVSGKSWVYYRITPKGKEAAVQLAAGLKPQVLDYINEVVAWVQRLSFVGLITAIYREYPEYKVNSVFIQK